MPGSGPPSALCSGKGWKGWPKGRPCWLWASQPAAEGRRQQTYSKGSVTQDASDGDAGTWLLAPARHTPGVSWESPAGSGPICAMRKSSCLGPGCPRPALRSRCAQPALTRLEAWHQIQIRTVPLPQWPQMAALRPDPVPSSRPGGSHECPHGPLSSLWLKPDPALSSLSLHEEQTPHARAKGPVFGSRQLHSRLACGPPAHSAPSGNTLPQPGSPLSQTSLSPYSPATTLPGPPCAPSWSPHTQTRGRSGGLWRAQAGSRPSAHAPLMPGGVGSATGYKAQVVTQLGRNPASAARTGSPPAPYATCFPFPICEMGK